MEPTIPLAGNAPPKSCLSDFNRTEQDMTAAQKQWTSVPEHFMLQQSTSHPNCGIFQELRGG